MHIGKHEQPYRKRSDKRRMTARFSTGLTVSKWTPDGLHKYAWMFQHVVDGEVVTEHGFSFTLEAAQRAIPATVKRMRTVVKLYQEIVETDDGTVDTGVELCRYLEVQTPPTPTKGDNGEMQEVSEAWLEACAKGKRFLIVGEVANAYFIMILGNEYKILKRGPRRLTIGGCYSPGKPYKGSPEFRHYGQHSDRAIAFAKRTAEHKAKLLAITGVDTTVEQVDNHSIETQTNWSN